MSQNPLYYRLVMGVLKPLYQLKLRLASNTKPDELSQRFGQHYPPIQTTQPMIWCHAVSLGETNTAEPILRALLAAGYALWITNTTHTGFNRVAELFAEQISQGEVYHSFVPVDDDKVIDKFLAHVNPIAALFIETELWATTLAKLAERQIASVLVNGRLSEKSFNSYLKARKLSQTMMENLSCIIAQDSESAKRFRVLGATSDKIRMASSLKWSSKANPLMIQRANSLSKEWQLEQRRLLLAASTHAGEEAAMLEAFAQLKTQFSDTHPLLIIVPRHPERFDEVASLIEKQGNRVVRRSRGEQPTQADSVYLADSMGELGAWYALADVAFVGGSLVNVGGHNPIEAAIVGKPIIMGHYTQSCQQVVNQLKQVGALRQVADTNELQQVFAEWLSEPQAAQQAGQAGQILAEQYQNATQQQLAMILDCINANQQQRLQRDVQKIDNAPQPTTNANGKPIIDDIPDV